MMWRMTRRLATATLTATLALALQAAPEAGAATVQSYAYETSNGIASPFNGPITFMPAHSSWTQMTTPGSFSLGTFTTEPLPTTATLTYNGTPFSIDLQVTAQGGIGFNSNPNAYIYHISGMLNGSISGDGTSSLMATITGITGSGSGQVTTPPFPIADLVISPQGIAAPINNGPGITTLTAQVTAAGQPLPPPAPEPSTIAVVGLALAGWAGRRRLRRAG